MRVTSHGPWPFKNLRTLRYLRNDWVQPTCFRAEATEEMSTAAGESAPCQDPAGSTHLYKGPQNHVKTHCLILLFSGIKALIPKYAAAVV